jgi:hypothetical protein
VVARMRRMRSMCRRRSVVEMPGAVRRMPRTRVPTRWAGVCGGLAVLEVLGVVARVGRQLVVSALVREWGNPHGVPR